MKDTPDPATETGRPRNGVVAGAGILVLLFLLATRCVPHPVGAARTYGKYEGKAVTTARGALSHVQTVRLTAEAASEDKAFGPFVAQVVSDAEEGLAGLQSTFDSILPPDERADALQKEVDSALSDAFDHVKDVRIAARRGELADLAERAAPLADDAARLQRFEEQHG